MKSFKENRIRAALLGTALTVAAAPATAAVIDENFNDVTGLATAGATRNVANISGYLLDTAPNELPRVQIGPVDLRSVGVLEANVRRTDNPINTSGGASGFDSHFTPVSGSNNFLVLGDTAGTIGGVPGTLVHAFAAPFQLPSGTPSVNVSYDWAFDGADSGGSVNDRFRVGILGVDANIATDALATLIGSVFDLSVNFTQLQYRESDTATGYASGSFSTTVSALPPASGSTVYYLVFGLQENIDLLPSITNSAVGIDNIAVTAVPVPAALPLLGSALVALSVIRRRRS
jgi:hypothetical protein